MKDSEFIELLNLYLDHEISAADAARLEAEVQTNQARRRIYQQYCRMQKGCKLVAADFHTEPVVVADRKVVPFNTAALAKAEARRRRMGSFYTVGTFAAVAACVAIVFVGRNRQTTEAAEAIVAAQTSARESAPASIANPQATFVAGASAAPRGLVSVPPRSPAVLVRDPLLLTGTTQAEAVLNAAVQEANNQLAWLESVQLAPLPQRPPADLHFASTLRSQGRPLGGRSSVAQKQSGEESDEMATFRFVK